MTINRNQLDQLNAADLIRDSQDAPTHPGEILAEEFMAPLALSASGLARALNVPPNRITALVKGQRGLSADTALRLARYFGTSAEFWLHLQTAYDLRIARRASAESIRREVSPRTASPPTTPA